MFCLHLGRHGSVAVLVAPTIGRMKDRRVSQYRNTEDAVKRPLSNGPDVTHPSIVRHPDATIPGERSLRDPVRNRVLPRSVSGIPTPRASGPSAAIEAPPLRSRPLAATRREPTAFPAAVRPDASSPVDRPMPLSPVFHHVFSGRRQRRKADPTSRAQPWHPHREGRFVADR